MDRDDPAYKGQRDYNRLLLPAYDPIVLGPVTRFVWRCPTPRLIDSYRQHIRDRHLDVGPGTGYFLERAGLPAGSEITILDPNTAVLRHVSQRLRSMSVTAIEADVLKPLPVTGPFESAALNAVIHCLPGPMQRKAAAITNIAAVLAPVGVLFGATVLGSSGQHNWAARRLLSVFNIQGGFDNLGDTEDGLREMLGASFANVQVESVGSIAVFSASNGPLPVPGTDAHSTDRSSAASVPGAP